MCFVCSLQLQAPGTANGQEMTPHNCLRAGRNIRAVAGRHLPQPTTNHWLQQINSLRGRVSTWQNLSKDDRGGRARDVIIANGFWLRNKYSPLVLLFDWIVRGVVHCHKVRGVAHCPEGPFFPLDGALCIACSDSCLPASLGVLFFKVDPNLSEFSSSQLCRPEKPCRLIATQSGVIQSTTVLGAFITATILEGGEEVFYLAEDKFPWIDGILPSKQDKLQITAISTAHPRDEIHLNNEAGMFSFRSVLSTSDAPTASLPLPLEPSPRSKGNVGISTAMSPALFLQSTLFANRANRLLQLINSLRDSGAQLNFDLNLPTVVVCGNQSAGKSSVIEALCGVPLPRADGTCTRTVTEVRMIADSDSGAERSAAWSCSVKLRYEYDEVGGPKATANATPMRAPREVPFGGPVQDPFMAEQLIRQAQRALLNPSSDPLLYCDTNAWRTKGSNELSFSRNVVCLEIFGAAVNLSLIDLPGIIRSVDRSEDAPYIDMIQDLVLSYIRQERSIIVGVITCKDEIENQAIVRMAKEVDPTGSRTIGVLTKPDTIESGTHDRWLSVMLGQTYALRLGYWMVKNPSKSELDQRINFEDARVKEETFFASRSPWANLRFQMDRFGVESLRNELGRHLANLIDSSVPTIKVRAEELLSATEVELNALPPPPLSNQFNLSPPSSTGISYVTSDPRIELLQMIRRLASRVALHLAAQERDYKQFYQIVRGHFEAFRRGLHSTRPLFAMEKPVAAGATRAPMEEKSSSSASSSSTSGYSSSLTSSVSWAISSVVWSSSSSTVEESKKKDSEKKFASQTSTKRLASSSPPSIHLMSPPPPQQRRSSSGSNGGLRPISLSDLRRIIESHKGRELQGTHVPPGAFTTVVSMFQEEWGRLASVCLTNISNDLHSLLSHLIEEEFGRFADLRGHVCNLVEAVLSEHYQSASIKLADLVAMERRLPFTLNQEEFVRLRGSALAEFRSQMDASMGRSSNSTKSSSSSLPSLLGSAPPTAPPESWTRAIAAISELGYPQLTPRDLALRLDTALAPSSSSSQQVGSAQSSNTPTASPKPGGGSLYSFASATSPAADEDELLQVMASSDAYFRLAFRRLSDVVPMHVDYFFLARLGETVEKELVVGLGVLERPPEDLLELLQEDRVIAERRRVLQDRKARLEGVWRALTEAVRTPAGLGLSRD